MNINLTLIGQTIAFAIFVWFCMKFIWPPIVIAMEERKKRIADGLAAAEEGQNFKKETEKEIKEMLDSSKKQAQDIISKAQKQASQIVEEAKEEAKVEADRIKILKDSELKQDINNAKNKLRLKISSLVMQGVRVVLAKEVDEKQHKELLTKISSSL